MGKGRGKMNKIIVKELFSSAFSESKALILRNVIQEKIDLNESVELDFTGIIMTDDLDMGATKSIDNKVTKALLAGNDLVIVTDYLESMNDIKSSIDDNTISEELIDKLAFRVLAWKYYKEMM